MLLEPATRGLFCVRRDDGWGKHATKQYPWVLTSNDTHRYSPLIAPTRETTQPQRSGGEPSRSGRGCMACGPRRGDGPPGKPCAAPPALSQPAQPMLLAPPMRGICPAQERSRGKGLVVRGQSGPSPVRRSAVHGAATVRGRRPRAETVTPVGIPAKPWRQGHAASAGFSACNVEGNTDQRTSAAQQYHRAAATCDAGPRKGAPSNGLSTFPPLLPKAATPGDPTMMQPLWARVARPCASTSR